MHASTAVSSSVLEGGENAGSGGRAIMLSINYWDSNEKVCKYDCMSVKIYIGLGRVHVKGDRGCAFVHAPLQDVGDILILIKSVRKRIQKCEGKRVCACWWIALFVSVPACVCEEANGCTVKY